MDIASFISGFYSALSLSCGVFFLTTRRLRAPFRQACGWLMVYGAVEVALYYILSNSGLGDAATLEAVCLCLDTTAIPFILLLQATIVDQDMRTTPFSKRWMRVALLEVPIIISMLVCACTQYEWRGTLAALVLIYNIVYVFAFSGYKLIMYERQLPNDAKGKRASVKWMWYLVALFAVEAVFYFSVGVYISAVAYYVILIMITCLATYFINRQSPIDTRQLFAGSIIEDDEPAAEAEDAPEKHSLTRSDIKEKVRKFLAEHPTFEVGVAERATQKLTPRDIYLCIMIIEGKRLSEMSQILAISPSSVEVARYRLRAKLNLNKGENLAKMLKALL